MLRTDHELWTDLVHACPVALSEIFRRHYRTVYNYAFRRTASWMLAEEAAQATFTALWRRANAGSVDPLRSETALPVLLSMARNESANATRSSSRAKALLDRVPHVADQADHADLTAAMVDEERQMSTVRRALARLPRAQQEVIELVAWSHCTTREAAEVLGVSEGTVKSRLSRARAKLATVVDERGNPL